MGRSDSSQDSRGNLHERTRGFSALLPGDIGQRRMPRTERWDVREEISDRLRKRRTESSIGQGVQDSAQRARRMECWKVSPTA